MKKIVFALALCALALSAGARTAPPASAAPADVCYNVTCRGGGHKPFSTRVCGSTDADAQAKARAAMGGHSGAGHAPQMSRAN